MNGSASTEVLLVAGALGIIVLAAFRLSGPMRVFLIAQGAFWGLSYIAVPSVLLTVQPDPQYGDNLPDPRLAVLGYDPGIAAVLRPVVFGLWLYALIVVGYTFWARRRRTPGAVTGSGYYDGPGGDYRAPIANNQRFIRTLLVLYAVGTVGRLAAFATGNGGKAGELESPNAILNLVTILATIGALGLLIYARPTTGRGMLLIVGGLTFGELLWTAAVQSKTPIMGAALALAVRFAMTGWTRRKVVTVLVLTVLAIGGFGWLQSLKANDEAKTQSVLADSSYPSSVRPFLSLLRRFDGLEAATDAYYAGPESWLTPDQTLTHALQTLVPTQLLGTEKFQSGAAWASEVRGQSVDMSGVEVSLAEGNINEGYVLGGYTGVALDVTFTFVMLLIWARALYNPHIPMPVFGLALIEVPVLFERGFLGAFETLGKYLQAMVLVWMVYVLVGEYQRRRATSATPRLPSDDLENPSLITDILGNPSLATDVLGNPSLVTDVYPSAAPATDVHGNPSLVTDVLDNASLVTLKMRAGQWV
ncbi:hypothetical protein [Nocardia sp. alder85J]|uniref:hypothetical protein n=1 Tax=Nocardia sp. alder85J TaxID=2862949 RepID=UPI001CD40963|nr:hypothetical protein [Nocardia sp. alder85J]MCX4093217.1 hypothetical protein [Nocardia sp. alder85J]